MTPRERAECVRNGFMGWGAVFFGESGAKFVEYLTKDFEQALIEERQKCAKIVIEFDNWAFQHGTEAADEAGQTDVIDTAESLKRIVDAIKEIK